MAGSGILQRSEQFQHIQMLGSILRRTLRSSPPYAERTNNPEIFFSLFLGLASQIAEALLPLLTHMVQQTPFRNFCVED